LKEASSTIFYEGRLFCNFYQAKQFVKTFSQLWGWKVASDGMRLHCSFSKLRKGIYKSTVSPSKKRKNQTSHKELKCPFRLVFSPVGNREEGRTFLESKQLQIVLVLFWIIVATPVKVPLA
jgi:hypothetical protein